MASTDVLSRELSIPFDKTFPIATYMGYTLSIRVVGLYYPLRQYFSAETFLILQPDFGIPTQIKGPKVEGSVKDGVHVGPITMPIPHIGTLDIWVKNEGLVLAITVKIVFFGKTYWKKFTLPLPMPGPGPVIPSSSYD